MRTSKEIHSITWMEESDENDVSAWLNHLGLFRSTPGDQVACWPVGNSSLIGLYAMVFGVLLLSLAFQRRRLRRLVTM
jgi:hypothetical protein